jgi:hypothetical protein
MIQCNAGVVLDVSEMAAGRLQEGMCSAADLLYRSLWSSQLHACCTASTGNSSASGVHGLLCLHGLLPIDAGVFVAQLWAGCSFDGLADTVS